MQVLLYPFFNLTLYGQPLCPAGISLCSSKGNLPIIFRFIRQWIQSIKIVKNFLTIVVHFISFNLLLLRLTLLIVALNRTRIGQNLGKQERNENAIARSLRGTRNRSRFLLGSLGIYSCSDFSLDVVCELLKVLTIRLLACGDECSQKLISAVGVQSLSSLSLLSFLFSR